MIVQKRKLHLKGSSDLLSYKEVAKYSDEHDPKKLFDFIFLSFQTWRVDEKIFCFIFRQIKPFLSEFFDNSPNTSKTVGLNALKALSKLILSSEFAFDVFLMYFTEHDIVKTFENLRALHEPTKEISKLIIECIYKKFQKSSSILQEVIANELLLFYAGPKNYREIEFILKLLRAMVINNDLGDCIEAYYEQFVLPSIVLMPFTGSDSVSMLLEAFCSHTTKCQKLSLKFLVKSFAKLDSIDHIRLMEMTTKILHIYFFKESSEVLNDDFSDILNLGLRSESYLVVDAAIDMINDNAVKRFIEVNIKSVLPRVFEGLYRLSKRFWRLEQRCRAIQAIGSILSIDGGVFESCLVEYNKMRYYGKYNDSRFDDEKIFNEKIKKMQSAFNE